MKPCIHLSKRWDKSPIGTVLGQIGKGGYCICADLPFLPNCLWAYPVEQSLPNHHSHCSVSHKENQLQWGYRVVGHFVTLLGCIFWSDHHGIFPRLCVAWELPQQTTTWMCCNPRPIHQIIPSSRPGAGLWWRDIWLSFGWWINVSWTRGPTSMQVAVLFWFQEYLIACSIHYDRGRKVIRYDMISSLDASRTSSANGGVHCLDASSASAAILPRVCTLEFFTVVLALPLHCSCL